jgi:hypothetical protein
MSKIVEVLGIPPPNVLERATRKEKFFERESGGGWVLKRHRESRKDHYRRPGSRSLTDILGVERGGPSGLRKGEAGHGPLDYYKFKDLIILMLDYNPDTRIKPLDALRHSFFKREVPMMVEYPHPPTQSVGMASSNGDSFVISQEIIAMETNHTHSLGELISGRHVNLQQQALSDDTGSQDNGNHGNQPVSMNSSLPPQGHMTSYARPFPGKGDGSMITPPNGLTSHYPNGSTTSYHHGTSPITHGTHNSGPIGTHHTTGPLVHDSHHLYPTGVRTNSSNNSSSSSGSRKKSYRTSQPHPSPPDDDSSAMLGITIHH